MNKNILFSKFSNALQWNSFLYVTYKIFYVALSFALYKTLSPELFSAWATINSIVFLILLWLDCGFRKSIPRYCPEFAQHQQTHKQFIALVLTLQSIVLLIGLPIIWYVFSHFVTQKTFISYALTLFAIGGVSELFKTIYHAHFWQKQFNLLQAVCMLTEMICNFWYLAHPHSSTQIVTFLLTTKIASNGGVLIGSIALLPNLLETITYSKKIAPSLRSLTKAFLEHSFMMWSATCIKSLSERNFLFPFLTNAFGAIPANLFKVVHDGALFFQRIAIRILGSSDTALLSYALVLNNTQTVYEKAFIRLFKTVIALIIPLTFLTIGVFFVKTQVLTQEMLVLFFIVALGYMFEVLLSPYERVLEVKRRYRLLWLSYAPYILGLGCLIAWPQAVSLLQWVVMVQALRLLSATLMAFFNY